MTDQFPQFIVTQEVKARFKRAGNRANTEFSLAAKLVQGVVPITSMTIDTSVEPEFYLLRVGRDGARVAFPFETIASLPTDPTVAYDAITFLNHGTYAPSVVHIAGPIVYPLPFTSKAIRTIVADSVVAPSPIDVGPGTFEPWVRTSATVGSATVIARVTTGPDSAGPTVTLKLSLNPGGTLTASKHNAVDVVLYSDSHPVAANDGAWHHIAVVDTGSALSLWMDGSLT